MHSSSLQERSVRARETLQEKEEETMSDIMNTEQEKEPMLLLDTTGSMNFATSEHDKTPRKNTIREAISLIVDRLAAADSQAAEEEEGGGLRTITVADGRAHDLGDLNPDNLIQKWNMIK